MSDRAEVDVEVEQEAPTAAVKEAPPQDDQSDDDQPAPRAKTLIGGDDDDPASQPKEPAKDPEKFAWDDRWREEVARHIAAGDEKIYAKELKRLERITSPAAIYGSYREMESRFTSGGLVKIPGPDAKPEEVAAFHKALGVPESPEDYTADLKLDNGAVIGEDDRPIVDGFAKRFKDAGLNKQQAQILINHYYQEQMERAAEIDERDAAHRQQTETALKEELGDSFKRHMRAIPALFAEAPGGGDASNPNSLFARLMGGRMADGTLIGDDPDAARFFLSMVNIVKPHASIVEGSGDPSQSIDDEISSIEKLMREDRRAYNQDHKKQARYLELLGARERMKARG